MQLLCTTARLCKDITIYQEVSQTTTKASRLPATNSLSLEASSATAIPSSDQGKLTAGGRAGLGHLADRPSRSPGLRSLEDV